MVNSSTVLSLSWQSFSKNFAFFVLAGMLFLIATSLLGYFALNNAIHSGFWSTIPWLLVSTLLYAKLAVVVHRCVLLKENQISDIFTFRSEDFTFFFAVCGAALALLFFFYLMSIVLLFLLDGLSSIYIAMSIIMIVIGIIASRVAMIFPSIAVKNGDNLAEVWEAGINHRWMLFFLIALIPILTGHLIELIPVNSILALILVNGIGQLVLMFEVVILSHAFDLLMRQAEPSEEATETPS